MVPLVTLTMDKLTHYLEPPLEAQLPTPVTLDTHCLVHRHVLVEKMETGHPLYHFVKTVSIYLQCLILCRYVQLNSTENTEPSNVNYTTVGIFGGVLAATLLIAIIMVILVLLIKCIANMRSQRKQK